MYIMCICTCTFSACQSGFFLFFLSFSVKQNRSAFTRRTRALKPLWPVSQKPGHTVTVSSGFLISSVRPDRSVLVTGLHWLCLKTYVHLDCCSGHHTPMQHFHCYEKHLILQFGIKKQHLSCAVRVVKHVGFDSEVGSPHKTSMLFKYLNHF